MMKKFVLTKLIVTLGIVLASLVSNATEWSRIVDLRGVWQFSVGDDLAWSKSDYDDNHWDNITVPANWERYYPEYNGFGWYRTNFDIRWMPGEGQLVLFLGYIDDVNEVFLNGEKIGQSGSFPPNMETSYNVVRKYFIPRELLKKTGNTLAVRVYDTAGPGGIVSGGQIGIYYDNDQALLSLDLSGDWKFTTYRESNVYDYNLDDSHWKTIRVPGNWEDQGFAGYDGRAWYRKKFKRPAVMERDDNHYLVLGKIDDTDRVFLNGELIGRTEYLEEYSRHRKYNSWRLYRVYKIPNHLIKQNNILVVEVVDEQQGGGIYEGPIGIMNARDAAIIRERNDTDFWNDPINYILDKIFE